VKWHLYVCEECDTAFAIEGNTVSEPMCPNQDCPGIETTHTGEVIIDPEIVGDVD